MIHMFLYKCTECFRMQRIDFDTEVMGREPTPVDLPDSFPCLVNACEGTMLNEYNDEED